MLVNNNIVLSKIIAYACAGFAKREIDQRFLLHYKRVFRNTSGVALGVDRLIMIALGAKSIKERISLRNALSLPKNILFVQKCDLDRILEHWSGSSIDTIGLFCNICDVYFGD